MMINLVLAVGVAGALPSAESEPFGVATASSHSELHAKRELLTRAEAKTRQLERKLPKVKRKREKARAKADLQRAAMRWSCRPNRRRAAPAAAAATTTTLVALVVSAAASTRCHHISMQRGHNTPWLASSAPRNAHSTGATTAAGNRSH